MDNGRIRFSADNGLRVTAWLLEDGARVTAGYGSWEVIERPRRLAMTQYMGRPPFEMTVPVVIDGYRSGDTIDVECSNLERMALPTSDGEPPIVEVEGPVPHDDLEWIVSGFEWGASLRDPQNGRRLRQEVTVKLLHHVDVDKIKTTAAAGARATTTSKTRSYKVKQGDTLSLIAKNQLHDASRWREIANLNNIQDPKHLRVNSTIKIPVK